MRVRFKLAATVALALSLVGCGNNSNQHSTDNYCKTFYEEGVKARNREVQDIPSSAPTDLDGLVQSIAGIADIGPNRANFWRKLKPVAPPEIQDDVDTYSEFLDRQVANSGDSAHPKQSFGSQLAETATMMRTFRRLEQFTDQNCHFPDDQSGQNG